MEEWRRLPKRGWHIGATGEPTANLWGWTLTCRERISSEHPPSYGHLQQVCETETTAEKRSSLQQLRQLLRPLTRRSCWTQTGPR
eukprot:scaffold42146_cov69-Cyclotella_meneghiniana.AAC.2